MSNKPSNERGVALILALIFTFLTTGIVLSGSMLLRADRTISEVRFRQSRQALQFARSGLTEAIDWFRRQTGQPVLSFSPARDLTVVPQIQDTDDPEIGLVRQFRIWGNTWGRYEVWRVDGNDVDPRRQELRRRFGVKDISVERGFTGSGNVWLIRSVGYVYERRSTTVDWDEAPNSVLAVASLEGEMRRLAIRPPSQGGLCISRGDSCTVAANGRVRGGTAGAGIIHPQSTGTPSIGSSAEGRVTGAPSVSEATTWDDSPEYVFGVSPRELRAMADLVVTDPNNFPDPVPTDSLIYVRGSGTLYFGPTRSLRGSGVVYVEGDVTIAAGNNTNYNGMLFVEGDLVMQQTSDIYGSVVVRGTANLSGAGDYSTIWFDDSVLTGLRRRIGQYRWSGAFRAVINRE